MSAIVHAIMGVSGGHKERANSRSFRHSEDLKKFKDLNEEAYDPVPLLQNLAVLATFYSVAVVFYHSVEGWSVLDCFYFLNVTIFTVGYGDFYPTNDHSKIFTVFVILFGLAFVFKIVEQFANFIIETAEEQARALLNDSSTTEETLLNQDPYKYVKKRLYAVFSILVVVLVGSIFYWCSEDWSFLTALYFCIVTTTTVGYGDLSPTFEGSRIFTMFYIPISVCAVAAALGSFTAIQYEMAAEKKKLEALSRKLDFDMLRELDIDGKGVDKLRFLVAMLIQTGVCEKKADIDPWLERFDELDADGSGCLDEDDIKLMEQQEAEKQSSRSSNHKDPADAEDLYAKLL